MKPTVPHIDPRTHLLASGLTEKQAGAIVETSNEIAARRIEEVRYELAHWHAYLALYLLIQIGIVLLVILLVRTFSEPLPRAVAVLDVVSAPTPTMPASSSSDWTEHQPALVPAGPRHPLNHRSPVVGHLVLTPSPQLKIY
jgi:hypothetical protein